MPEPSNTTSIHMDQSWIMLILYRWCIKMGMVMSYKWILQNILGVDYWWYAVIEEDYPWKDNRFTNDVEYRGLSPIETILRYEKALEVRKFDPRGLYPPQPLRDTAFLLFVLKKWSKDMNYSSCKRFHGKKCACGSFHIDTPFTKCKCYKNGNRMQKGLRLELLQNFIWCFDNDQTNETGLSYSMLKDAKPLMKKALFMEIAEGKRRKLLKN
jgi:hypothetical protein